ncbi:MAG: hypothetical protein IKA63_02465 [Clostridia bacterium]|nr:hypothetical protein [Clostridia bacterium]
MDGIRTWSALVCCGAVGCCAVQLLVPPEGTGKIFRLVVITFFLCCVITPLLKVSSQLSLPVEFLPEDIVSQELNERVEEQLKIQVESVVTRLVEEGLATREVRAKKITVNTDTSEDGSIYIQQVVVQVDKQAVSPALIACEMLEEQLGVKVSVVTQE